MRRSRRRRLPIRQCDKIFSLPFTTAAQLIGGLRTFREAAYPDEVFFAVARACCYPRMDTARNCVEKKNFPNGRDRNRLLPAL